MAYNKVWVQNNKHKIKIYQQRYNEKHKELLAAKRQERYKRDYEKISKANVRGLLKMRHGITPEDRQFMFDAQGGTCPICQEQMFLIRRGQKAAMIDHDHATGKIRQLLCSQCNRALGQFEENIVRLKRAISYLKEHGKR